MSTNSVARGFLLSNLAVILCCACYVLWWILAFNPVSPVGGMKSGWLLVPAFVAGLVGILLAVWTGTRVAAAGKLSAHRLFVPWRLVLAGVVGYLVLLLITRVLFNRQVTAELFLMVGWAVLVLYQLNALYGAGVFDLHRAEAFVGVVLAALVVFLVCYTIYYRLGVRSGFVVGIIPLALGGVLMGVISAAIRHSLGR